MLVLVAVVRVRLAVVFDLLRVLVLVAVSCANSTNMLVLVAVVGRVRLVVVFYLTVDGLNFVG